MNNSKTQKRSIHIYPYRGNNYSFVAIDVDTYEIHGWTNDPKEIQFTGLIKDDNGNYTIPALDASVPMPEVDFIMPGLLTDNMPSVLVDLDTFIFFAHECPEPMAYGFHLCVVSPSYLLGHYVERGDTAWSKTFREKFNVSWLSYQFVCIHCLKDEA